MTIFERVWEWRWVPFDAATGCLVSFFIFQDARLSVIGLVLAFFCLTMGLFAGRRLANKQELSMRDRLGEWIKRVFICWPKGHVAGRQIGRFDDQRCHRCRVPLDANEKKVKSW